ncbi:MAG TPA: hypothetical protein VJ723_00960 [Candidatus Angelobacter sp.]|nr:hypothetical protein [Candidatus Angelobacter sp.]
MPERELQQVLEDQLIFFESGGYGHAYRSSWRPTLVIRDSPLCLHATLTPTRSCRECVLLPLIPGEKRNALIPCHHIPLNAIGETIATMYESASQERLDKTFHDWLCAKIQDLRKER